MIQLSIGTFIDALAVGISFTFMVDSIIGPCITISLITHVLSSLGIIFTNKIKDKIKTSPQKFGELYLSFYI